MNTFMQQLLNGIVSGSTFALLALGFTLVFGILRVLNIAHPAIFTWGAFLTYAGAEAGLPVVLIFVLAVAGSAAWGIALDRLVFRWLRTSAHITPFIATMGVTLFMQSLAVKIWGPQALPVQYLTSTEALHVGGVQITVPQLLTVGGALVLLGGLWFLLERTWFGKAIRATSENAEAASAVGINVELVLISTIALASAFAGVAGFLVANLFHQVSPYMGDSIGLIALVVIMIGGLGNIVGAVLGGVLLGLVQSLTTGYVSAAYSDGVVYVFAFLILVIWPTGLLGERLRRK
jgi:branched-chain amino acid transport system permease protein